MSTVPDDDGLLARQIEYAAPALGALFALLSPERQAQVVSPMSSRVPSADSYERLEYVGDGVLELVVRIELYRRHHWADEAALTLMRDWVVGREVLALLARASGLSEAMSARLAADPQIEGSARRTKRQSDLIEALAGAAWFDLGPEPTQAAIVTALGPALDAAPRVERDPKSRLHHIAQTRGLSPIFEHERRGGTGRLAHFECWAVLAGERHGPGRGLTKRAAEQEASGFCLRSLAAAVG